MTTPDDLVKLARACGAKVMRSPVGDPPNFIFGESCLAAFASRIASQASDPEWSDVRVAGMPPCDGETVFVGENSAGYMGCFNTVYNGPEGDCWMVGPEVDALVMSDLRYWRLQGRPPHSDAIKETR